MPGLLAVCRLPADAPLPAWALTGEFYALVRTTDELSVVCAQEEAPEGVVAERDWQALKLEGPLAFSMVGVLAAVTATLAAAGVSLFAISTYDTDYILTKAAMWEKVSLALQTAGHVVLAGPKRER